MVALQTASPKRITPNHTLSFSIACTTKRLQRVEAGENAVVLPRLQSDRSAHVANKSLHRAAPSKYGVMRDLWIYWSQATWSLNSASVLKHLAGTVPFTIYTQQNLPWRINAPANTQELNRLLWNKIVYYILNSRIRQWSLTYATKIWSTASKLIQGVSRLVDITAGGDFLGLCYQKSSYKHVSDFGRLRSYDCLKPRIEGNDYWQ